MPEKSTAAPFASTCIRVLLAQGEDLQRINSVLVWPETTFFECPRTSRAGRAEALTEIAGIRASFALVPIPSWIRLAIGFPRPVQKAPSQSGGEVR